MTVSGIDDLNEILTTLSVVQRPGVYVFVSVAELETGQRVEASIEEEEGTTLVVTRETARSRGWSYELEAAWLTLEVHSSLAAVGLTARVSEALAKRGIPCNVLAGYYHDHLLVPVDRAEEAMEAVSSLKERPGT